MDIRITQASCPGHLADTWQALERHCAASPFQCWAWIGPWLRRAVAAGEVWLVEATERGTPHALALITLSRTRRRRLLPVRQLYLNESGPSALDFCIEHNGFLVRPGREREVIGAMVDGLARWNSAWDELHIRRVRLDAALPIPAHTLRANRLELRTLDSTDSPFVDLAAVRASGRGYLDTLSPNRRSQIRRGLKRLKQFGALAVSTPGCPQQAQAYFTELKRLHQKHWVAKGLPGAFANPAWEAFHREVIAGQFADGGVQLLRIAAGEFVLGYIYSLVKDGWVYMIQTGMNYAEPALRPGELSHVLAIEWNLAHDNRAYDFLGGDARYKSALATGTHRLDSLVLRRRRLKFAVEDGARRVLRLFKVLRTARAVQG